MSEPPTVRPDSFLTLHYRLSALENPGGEAFVSTFDFSPATLQMGSGQWSEGLERCLLGLPEGERRVFELAPREAFGETNPRLVERIARAALPPDAELKQNALVEFTAPNGANFSGFLRELSDTHALFDFNHPLAGKSVRLEVEILAIL
jgi:FKBP-type peptidyl-prolyl cis-trans isomerase SlpA